MTLFASGYVHAKTPPTKAIAVAEHLASCQEHFIVTIMIFL
jgi:hypothetical protein